MSITPLPTAPAVTDTTSEFNTKAFNWVAALDTFTTEANALASAVDADATAAAADADAAEAAAIAATAAANAELWVSGTTYAIGDVVYSPINLQSYRRVTNGAGTTDPSADATNWTQISQALVAASQAEMETGTEAALRSMSPLRVAQAINALASGGFSTMAVVTSSQTWTIPAGVTKLKVTVVGGGGNGGNGSGARPRASGGGGGGAAIKYFTNLTPGNTLTVTVGSAGGTSSVASGTQTISTISATGGANGANALNSAAGGNGGIGSGGTLNIGGSGGGAAETSTLFSGHGGNSIFGGGAAGRANDDSNGNPGRQYGGGGGGATGETRTGGAGFQGVVIFEY